MEAGESETQGHLCFYNKLEANASYIGPGLKENKKRKPPTPLLGVMAEDQGGSRRPEYRALILQVPGKRGRGLMWACPLWGVGVA